MKRLLIKIMRFMSLAVLAWPVAAQVNQVLRPPSTIMSNFATAAVPSRTQASMMEPHGTGNQERTLYRWSVATVVAVNAADVLTSWSRTEANPVIARPGAQFGVSSVALKSGFVGASLLLQHVALRHHPGWHKRLAWMNFVTSGVLGGVAAHNARVR